MSAASGIANTVCTRQRSRSACLGLYASEISGRKVDDFRIGPLLPRLRGSEGLAPRNTAKIEAGRCRLCQEGSGAFS